MASRARSAPMPTTTSAAANPALKASTKAMP